MLLIQRNGQQRCNSKIERAEKFVMVAIEKIPRVGLFICVEFFRLAANIGLAHMRWPDDIDHM